MLKVAGLLANLVEVPEERLLLALADAVFRLQDSDVAATNGYRRFEFCLSEADVIRARLRAHGYTIVRTPLPPL